MNSRQLLNTPLPPSKSDVTEVTDFTGVTNLAFIDAIFQNTIHSKPIVINFKGSPAEKQNWSGKAFDGHTSLPDTHNNYLSMCSYRPNEKGQYAVTGMVHVHHSNRRTSAQAPPLQPKYFLRHFAHLHLAHLACNSHRELIGEVEKFGNFEVRQVACQTVSSSH